MREIESLLDAFLSHYAATRGAGHTTAACHGPRPKSDLHPHADILIVATQAQTRDEWDVPEGVELMSLAGALYGLCGRMGGALVFDNAALIQIFSLARAEICRLQKERNDLARALADSNDRAVTLHEATAELEEQVKLLGEKADRAKDEEVEIASAGVLRLLNRLRDARVMR